MPVVGVRHFSSERQVTHFGAALRGPLVEHLRALGQTPIFQAAHRHNPLDLLFKFDNNINNRRFRQAVLYSQLKRQAFRNMGDASGRFTQAVERAKAALTGTPDEMLRKQAKHQDAFEEAARATNEILGNYTRYTAKERQFFERNFMFYGFLRFSVRWAFYTMPIKHPVMTAIGVELSKLHENEVRQLLGVGPDDPLAPGALSSIFTGGKEVPFQRFNPALNVLTQASGPNQLAGSLSPIALEAINQLAGKNIYTGAPYQVKGSAENRKNIDLTSRGRIFLEDWLRFATPYRAGEQLKFKGAKQGADTLLFSPRPTHYKSSDAIQRNELRKAIQGRKTFAQVLLEQLIPGWPRESDIQQRQKGYLQATGKKAPASGFDFSTAKPSSSPSMFDFSTARPTP
jgi:hypothetical protein